MMKQITKLLLLILSLNFEATSLEGTKTKVAPSDIKTTNSKTSSSKSLLALCCLSCIRNCKETCKTCCRIYENCEARICFEPPSPYDNTKPPPVLTIEK